MSLVELRKLKPNWDSYGGKPMSPEALDVARIITETQPAIVPRSNGGIQIEWLSEWYLAITIGPDGQISAWGASARPTRSEVGSEP